jgi:uncharacterized membrane protein YphA (DoxX/SURF4 family)
VIDNDLLTMLARLAVGITFIYASYYKVVDPGAFAKTIWFYHLVPGSLINIIAIVLPWVELICGLGIMFGFSYRGAVVLANALTLVFILALSSAILRGISLDCGCFKAAASSTNSAWKTLWFDLVLMLLALQLLFSRSRRWFLARP